MEQYFIMKNIITKVIDKIKIIFQKYAYNESHTISSDIREYIATYILGIGYYFLYILPNGNDLKRTRMLKNTKKGKKCFVFSTGPSLSLLDIKKIEKYQKSGFDVISNSTYISHEIAKVAPPNYYLISDPASFGVRKDYLSDEFYNDQKQRIETLNKLNIPVFIPAQFINLNLIKNYYVFNDFENRFNRNTDLTKPRGYSSLTGYKTLAIACYMGYDTIYICGMDNDFLNTLTVDENNEIFMVVKHFFDSGAKYKTGPTIGKGIGNLMWEYYLAFQHLELFTCHNIINLNKNSLIDTFSKKHDLDIYKQ
jgi:hypothetical protein